MEKLFSGMTYSIQFVNSLFSFPFFYDVYCKRKFSLYMKKRYLFTANCSSKMTLQNSPFVFKIMIIK